MKRSEHWKYLASFDGATSQHVDQTMDDLNKRDKSALDMCSDCVRHSLTSQEDGAFDQERLPSIRHGSQSTCVDAHRVVQQQPFR